jgi:uncharacterized membrane protein YadS
MKNKKIIRKAIEWALSALVIGILLGMVYMIMTGVPDNIKKTEEQIKIIYNNH